MASKKAKRTGAPSEKKQMHTFSFDYWICVFFVLQRYKNHLQGCKRNGRNHL
jgi:hypothetical protein